MQRAEGRDERRSIVERIRALLAKTVERGCTEHEALSAARLASELLERHGLAMDEVEMRASPFAQPESTHSGDVAERLSYPVAAIAALTSTRHWYTRNGDGSRIYSFLGLEHEAKVAGYLLDICARAMRDETERACAAHALYVPAKRRRLRLAFLDGMARGLHDKIMAMRPPRPPGRGLVPVRDGMLDEEMARRGVDPKASRHRLVRDWEAEYGEGVKTGLRTPLDPAIGSGGAGGALPRSG